MKIQIASDLHLEIVRGRFADCRILEPAPDADILILAGDIASSPRSVTFFKDWPVPVLLIAGNHEFYGQLMPEARNALRQAAQGTNVQFLDNDSVVIDGVCFLGCTLWTDYCLEGAEKSAYAMGAARRLLNDHRMIRLPTRRFRPSDAAQEHSIGRRWLQQELDRRGAGSTVVLSHHAPHPGSIHPRFAGDLLNAAFCSDLTSLLLKADLWIHGHMHDSCDYWVDSCRVMANPLGYPLNLWSACTPQALRFENAAFNPSCVVEVS